VNADRPVNLPLPRLFAAMPVTAVASILHRFTGIVLFVGVFFLCYLLDLGMADQAGFERAAGVLAEPLGKFALWAILSALGYHVAAGIKHLLMDFHVGDSFRAGRIGAWLSIGVAVVLAVLAGLWLW
jgi:succinate dehydrogenase / fumarate reductase cytochrome b subunit